MKIALLTTETTHHAYFACKLQAKYPFEGIFVETKPAISPFDTRHPFEDARDAYEREVLLKGLSSSLSDVAPTRCFESMNDPACVSALRGLSPDVALVFGTGKLLPRLIESPGLACLNLHGGNPEHYRGLDTHLWAIYHRDFENLVTTLHYVDSQLDTGDIVLQSQVGLKRESKLYELRALNTQVCVELCLLALTALDSFGYLPSRKQVGRGRYYSFMPAALKEDCVKKFETYVKTL